MRNVAARVSDPNTFITCCGVRMKTIYKPRVLKDGTIKLVPSEKVDLLAEIQSFAPMCDISYILNRIKLGDDSVLRQTPGMYGDFTGMPSTLAEVMQLRIDAEDIFRQLPLDVRNKFDNSFDRFFATMGSKEWNEYMTKPASSSDEVKPIEKEAKE